MTTAQNQAADPPQLDHNPPHSRTRQASKGDSSWREIVSIQGKTAMMILKLDEAPGQALIESLRTARGFWVWRRWFWVR